MGYLCPWEAVAQEELKNDLSSQLSAVGDRDSSQRDHLRAGEIPEVLTNRSYSPSKETAKKGSKETFCNMRARNKLYSGP